MRLPKPLRLVRYAAREFGDTVLRPHAGAYAQGKYRVYGEGSEYHNGHTCRYGMDQFERHPLVQRDDYPSKRAYYRRQIADWWFLVQMARSDPWDADGQPHAVLERPGPAWLDRAMRKLFGDPFPLNHVWAGMRPEDSIYPSREPRETLRWLSQDADDLGIYTEPSREPGEEG